MKRRFYGRVSIAGRLYRASVVVNSKDLPRWSNMTRRQLREYVRVSGVSKCFFKVMSRVWEDYAAFYHQWPFDERTQIEWWRICYCSQINTDKQVGGTSTVYISAQS